MEALFHSHFEMGHPANDLDAVVECVLKAGYNNVTAEEVRTFWVSDKLARETLAKEQSLKERYPLATGAPHFVIEGLGLVKEPVRQLSGAQPPQVFAKIFSDLIAIHVRQQAQQQQQSVQSPTSTNTAAICAVCQKPSSKRCTGCGARRYCSVDCQKRDWPTHKAQCKPSVCGPDGSCAL